MSQSTKQHPISNGQTITYRATITDPLSGDPVNVSGHTITYHIKFRGVVYGSGSGTVITGASGIVEANIQFQVNNIMDLILEQVPATAWRNNRGMLIPVNVQFYNNGAPSRPTLEYVAPNVNDLAETSLKVIEV